MGKYDDLFDDTRADESVFADKSALDPLAEPTRSSPGRPRNAAWRPS